MIDQLNDGDRELCAYLGECGLIYFDDKKVNSTSCLELWHGDSEPRARLEGSIHSNYYPLHGDHSLRPRI